MPSQVSEPIPGAAPAARTALVAARLLAATMVLAAVVILAGWILDVAVLKSVVPGLVSMKANTVLGFLLAGCALLLQRSARPAWRRAAGLATALVIGIGFVTLVQYAFGLNLGIDELLFRDNTAGESTSHPGRMAPGTALNLLLGGIAIATLRRAPDWSRTSAVVVFLLGMLAFCGYLFSVEALYRFSDFTSMALHTSVLFLLLGLALIAARPDRGWVRVVVSPTAGGVAARQLLPAVPIALLTLGGLSLTGLRLGYYDVSFSLALVVVGGIAVITPMILLVAQRLERLDRARQRARRELDRTNANLERSVEERTAALSEANRRLAEEVEERRRAEAHVRELSITDELTGLLNRRGFFLLAEQELRTSRRSSSTCALYYLDLDNLKVLNDRYGHEAGDALLRGMAELLKWTCREADVIARLGGDEFVVLVVAPGDPEGLIPRLRKAAEAYRNTATAPDELRFSIGTAICEPGDERSLEELLRDADARMYEDKRHRSSGENEGRNHDEKRP